MPEPDSATARAAIIKSLFKRDGATDHGELVRRLTLVRRMRTWLTFTTRVHVCVCGPARSPICASTKRYALVQARQRKAKVSHANPGRAEWWRTVRLEVAVHSPRCQVRWEPLGAQVQAKQQRHFQHRQDLVPHRAHDYRSRQPHFVCHHPQFEELPLANL